MKVYESQEMEMRYSVRIHPIGGTIVGVRLSRRITISERATCMTQTRPMIRASKKENPEMKSVERILANMSRSKDTFLV